MSIRNGGEATDGLAPVIPLFGVRAARHAEAGADPVGDARVGDDPAGDDAVSHDASRRWHTTWTRDSRDDADEARGRPAEAGSAAGRSLTARPDRAADLDLDEPRQQAERMLLRKLRTRSLSVREARAALVAAEIDGAAAEHVLTEFEERGYLDDARLAEQLLDSALGRKAQGASAIARTLSQRGLDRDVIDIALASLPDDEAERALEFARQRVRSLSGLDRDVALRRLHGQLARRGFGGSMAMDAARRALDEDDR